jgi:EAL domain-containing protein (putative c-di-GMP-specific phosphodiesterase class I)
LGASLRGLLRAGEFVAIAEETGLIVPVGEWVVREACRQVGDWQAAAPHVDVAVNVNLSAMQLRHPGLKECIISALSESGVDPQSLTLELTESAALADLDAAARVLRQLRRIGVRLALDDFGTGHSSLGYLHRLPVHDVKIDRTFVAGLGNDRVATAIVAAVASVASAVGMTVTAEGIETAKQLRTVGALGCDLGQGHFIGRPQSAAAITALFAATPHWHSPDGDFRRGTSGETGVLGNSLTCAAD